MFPNCGVQVRIQKLSFQIYLLSDFDSEIITECTEIFSLGNKAAKSLKYLGSRLVVVFKRALDHDFEKKLLGSEWASVSFTSKSEISHRSFGGLFNHNFFKGALLFLDSEILFLYPRYPLKYWLEVGLYWKAPDHSLLLPKPRAWGPVNVPTSVNPSDLFQIAIKRPFQINFDHIFACTLWRMKTSNQINIASDTRVLETENLKIVCGEF